MTGNTTSTTAEVRAARPFIKWAGGKSQLLPQFARLYPEELRTGSITRYIEPFLGGGAVFLDVVQRYGIHDVRLYDINPEMILVYCVVKREPHALIELLSRLNDEYYSSSDGDRRRLFYAVREAYNAQRPSTDYKKFSDVWIVRAARMIFLNKTCFNGLYRVNSKGAFNVPFGKYRRPTILDAANILRVSCLLQNARLQVGDFQVCAPHIDRESFVYFDPPYRPLSATASFTAYSKDRFTDTDQTTLARFFARMDEQTQAKLMLSNSNPRNANPEDEFFDKLYAPFNIHYVSANRMINSNVNGRGKITELVITNY